MKHSWIIRLKPLLALALVSLSASAFAADAGKPVALFNGKDLTGWKLVGGKGANQWKFGKASMDPSNPKTVKVDGAGTDLISPESGANLVSEESFGDCKLELEFMVAEHSNSGVKLNSIYEIQIFDSFGKATADDKDCGAVYMENPPKVNACKKPGEWQSLVIDFRAPRFDASGKKIANAKFVKVTLNGQTIQENVEVAHGTNVSRNAKEVPAAPIYLQGDHGPVAFRNFKVTRL